MAFDPTITGTNPRTTDAQDWIDGINAALDASPAAFLERHRGSPLALRRPIILDGRGLLGGGPAIYVPNALIFSSAEAGGDFSHTFTTSDTKMTDHVKVDITPTASARALYYDQETDGLIYDELSAVPIDAERYFHLITTYGTSNQRGQGWTSDFLVHEVEDSGATVYATDENFLAFDAIARKLYVPDVSGIMDGAASWQMESDQPFFGHREVDIPDDDYWQVWIDTNVIANDGNRADAALVLTTDATTTGASVANKSGHAGMVLVATGHKNTVTPAAPFQLAKTILNEFSFGKKGFEEQEQFFSSGEFIGVTDGDLLDLGFDQGIRSTATSKTIFAGGPLLHGGGQTFVFYRFYVQAPSDNDFGTPRVYFRYKVESGTEIERYKTYNEDAEQYREISARAREYYGVIALDGVEDYTHFMVGGSFGADDCVVTGIQYAQSTDPAVWIGVNDYPTQGRTPTARLAALEHIVGQTTEPADFVIPPHVYMIEGRSFTLYPDQMSRATKHGSMRCAIGDTPDDATTVPKTVTSYGDSIRIDDSFTGDSLEVYLHDLGKDTEFTNYRSVDLTRVTAAAVSALPAMKVASIGDSLTEVYVFAHLIARLNALGITTTTLGTIDQTSNATGDADVVGEGRGGTGLADVVYSKTGEMDPPSSPAVYLAASSSAREDFNPFIREEDGDDPSVVNNGYVFDYAYYIENYLADVEPDVVYIGHGYNDVTDNFYDRDEVDQIYTDDLQQVLNSVRAALPSALIVVSFYSIGRFTNNDRWDQNQWAALQATLESIDTIADSNTIFIPGYCATGRDAGYQYDNVSTDRTGLELVEKDDFTHPNAQGVREFGEVAAQFIAAKLAS